MLGLLALGSSSSVVVTSNQQTHCPESGSASRFSESALSSIASPLRNPHSSRRFNTSQLRHRVRSLLKGFREEFGSAISSKSTSVEVGNARANLKRPRRGE